MFLVPVGVIGYRVWRQKQEEAAAAAAAATAEAEERPPLPHDPVVGGTVKLIEEEKNEGWALLEIPECCSSTEEPASDQEDVILKQERIDRVDEQEMIESVYDGPLQGLIKLWQEKQKDIQRKADEGRLKFLGHYMNDNDSDRESQTLRNSFEARI